MPFQYGNPANPLAHQEGTAQEIIRDLPEVTHFVAGMGTGGTLTGNGRGLHAHDPNVKIVAAEPELGDMVYGLRSLDAGFIPPIFDPSEIDRKFLVDSSSSLRTNRELTSKEGIFAGISSGAVVYVAQRIAERDRSRRRRLPASRRRLEVPVDRGLGGGPRDGRERRRGVALVVSRVSDPRPVGVFDSGVGGLTVVRAIMDQLPHEAVLYVGDTARFPYGPKPIDEIRRYALEIADYLVHRDVKMLVVACNSIEVTAIDHIATRAGVPVVGVIDPGTRAAVRTTRNGTRRPDRHRGDRHERGVRPCRRRDRRGGLAALGGLSGVRGARRARRHDERRRSGRAARGYLSPLMADGIDTLILGCTHYPLLSGLLQLELGPGRRARVVGGGDGEGRLCGAARRRSPERRPARLPVTSSWPRAIPRRSSGWRPCSSVPS